MCNKRAFLGLSKAAGLSGVSLLTLGLIVGPVPLADAQVIIREAPIQRFQGFSERLDPRRLEPRDRPIARDPARRHANKPVHPAAGLSEKLKEAPPPPGPHMLIVSVRSQRVSFYANGKLVSRSPVSTGMQTHPTPHGVFSIIQRNRHHRSNIYSGAPMPYMQRLTWSGVALHQGALPGHPASHGCIRLPEQYANYLWRTTKMNTRVIVSREDVEPFDVTHALLFQPKPAAATVETVPELRKTIDTTAPARVRTAGIAVIFTDGAAENETGDEAKAAAQSDPAHDAQRIAEPKQADPATPDLASTKSEPIIRDLSASVARARANALARPELAAQNSAETAQRPETTASIDPRPADIPDTILASFAQSLEAKQKKAPPSGAISVFISKKEKRLYVRQHFIPLFSAPVSFRDDKDNFGTHVFTALGKDASDKELRWIAVTLPRELPKMEKVKTRIEFDRRGRPIEVPVTPQGKAPEPIPSLSAAAVLDRIEIAPEVVDRISEYVSAGASLIVSDHGLGYETGLYTDFIVVTR